MSEAVDPLNPTTWRSDEGGLYCPACDDRNWRAEYTEPTSQTCSLQVGDDGMPYADEYRGGTKSYECGDDESYRCGSCDFVFYLPEPERPATPGRPARVEHDQ